MTQPDEELLRGASTLNTPEATSLHCPPEGLPELTPACFPCQINNYLTVPAHKLDSPTMSRARIGSGKAGHRCLGRGLAAGCSRPLSPERASESQQGERASPSWTSSQVRSSSVRWSWGVACCPPQGQSAPGGADSEDCEGSWVLGRGQEGSAPLGSPTCEGSEVRPLRPASLGAEGDSGRSPNCWSEGEHPRELPV